MRSQVALAVVVRAYPVRSVQGYRRDGAGGGSGFGLLHSRRVSLHVFSSLITRFLPGNSRGVTFRLAASLRPLRGVLRNHSQARLCPSSLLFQLHRSPRRDLPLFLLQPLLQQAAASQPPRMQHLAGVGRGDVRGEVRIPLSRQALDPVRTHRGLRHSLHGDV